MKKTPNLFVRDWDGDRSLVTREVNEEANWVALGEGIATKKFDGTCVLIGSPGGELVEQIDLGNYWRRFDVKFGRVEPDNFVPAQGPDPVTGHWTGWIPVDPKLPQDKWHMDAILRNDVSIDEILSYYAPGTYELCGPKIGGNPEGFENHLLVKHGEVQFPNFPTTFDAMKQALAGLNVEGIVWHHPDGRMAKIKKSDFGLKRKP